MLKRFAVLGATATSAMALMVGTSPVGRAAALPPTPRPIACVTDGSTCGAVGSGTVVSELLVLVGNATITSDGGACGAGDGDVGVDWVGGCGGFTWTGTSAGVSVGDASGGEGPLPEVGTSTLSGTGSFDSFACGTGAADGIGTVSTGVDAGESLAFGISFYAFVGQVYATLSGDVGNGVVVIGPSVAGIPPLGDTDNCATGFTFIAATVLLETPAS